MAKMLNSVRLKEQRELVEDKRHTMTFANSIASLTVRETTQKDAGSYTCEASNDLGTVTTSGVLEIQGTRLIFEHYLQAFQKCLPILTLYTLLDFVEITKQLCLFSGIFL